MVKIQEPDVQTKGKNSHKHRIHCDYDAQGHNQNKYGQKHIPVFSIGSQKDGNSSKNLSGHKLHANSYDHDEKNILKTYNINLNRIDSMKRESDGNIRTLSNRKPDQMERPGGWNDNTESNSHMSKKTFDRMKATERRNRIKTYDKERRLSNGPSGKEI